MRTNNSKGDEQWLADYLERYQRSIFQTDVRQSLIQLRDKMLSVRDSSKKVIFSGNGGSSAIASHCAVDFTKQAGVRSVNFNETDLITCFANDYGYERWIEKALEFYADAGDLVVLVSSSGESANMVRAAEHCNQRELAFVTFTGMDASNSLRGMGHLDFWVDSWAYNIIEMTHHVWLLAVCDLIIGSPEYSAS